MNNSSIKFIYHRWITIIIATILGFFLWYQIAKKHHKIVTISIPICFYNATTSIASPETINACIQGTHYDIYLLKKNSAVHIDAQHLTTGTHDIAISPENLFLPHSVKLLHLVPSIITIQI